MFNFKRLLLLSMLAIVPSVSAEGLSDSLLIEGHWTQQSQDISRHQLEQFLLKQNASADLTDKSKAYGVSSFAVGGPMWLITTGFTVWEGVNFYNAIKKNEPINTNIPSFTLTLVIGAELSSFIQGLLSHRSDYLLHKAVKAYDSSVYQRYNMSLVMDHRIKEARPGWYLQDRLLMPTSVLYSVLKEKEASHTAANTSLLCRGIAINSGFIGGILISNAIVGFIEGGLGTGHVDVKLRNTQLGIGTGLAFIAGIFSIISGGIRDKAIDYYNEPFQNVPQPSLQLDQFSPAPAAPAQEQH